MAGLEGVLRRLGEVLRRLGEVLSLRNGSSLAEKWTSVSPCRAR